MFSTPFTFLKASGGGYDPNAQAYIDQVIAVGGTLTTTEMDAVNQLTLDLKAAGIWSKFDILLPVLGNTAASSKINLLQPSNATYDWDYLGTPTFSSTGIKGNGTNAAVRSIWKINDLVQSQIGNSHWAVYQKYYANPYNTSYLNGTLDTDAGYIKFGLGAFGGGAYGGIYQDNWSGGVPEALNGFLYTEAETSTLASRYTNNTFVQSSTNTQSAFSSTAGNALLGLYWYSYNANRVYDEYSTNEIRAFSVGAYLTPTQRTDYATAMETYQQTLSRSAALQIGEDFQGGKIAYLSSPTSGLIIASGGGGIWSTDNNIVSTGTSIGTGDSNTNNMASQGGGSPIASAALANTTGGYSDWYIPSLDEMAQVYANRAALGIASSGRYWTSSQYSPSQPQLYAYAYDFGGGYGAQQDKQDSLGYFIMRNFSY